MSTSLLKSFCLASAAALAIFFLPVANKSTIAAPLTYGNTVIDAQVLLAGTNGFGAVELNDGLSIQVEHVVIGADPSSNGFVIVRGANLSTVGGAFGQITVGARSHGALTIEDFNGNEGIVTAADGINIGSTVGGTGSVTVGNGGELLSQAYLDHSASVSVTNGALHILSGGIVTTTRIRVGGPSGSSGILRVKGAGSKLMITEMGNCCINSVGGDAPTGFGSTGLLVIEDGGTVELTQRLNLGHSPGSSGVVLVDGANSSLNLSGLIPIPNSRRTSTRLAIGRAGSGSLKITNGGTVTVDPGEFDSTRYATVSVGGRTGSNAQGVGPRSGFLLVNGVGSLLKIDNSKQRILIGRRDGAQGVMHVTGGGKVYLTNVDGLSFGGIATASGSTGSVIVDGEGEAEDGSLVPSLWDSGSLLGCAKNFDVLTNPDPPLTEDNLSDSGGIGTLAVRNGGIIKADIVVIGSSCTLLGDGMVDAGLLINEGTILPGNSPGTLTLTNDVSHAGSLVMEVLGTVPGQFDVLKVGGTIIFQPGSTINVVTRSATLSPGIAVIVDAADIQGSVLVLLEGGTATQVDATGGTGIAVVVDDSGTAQVVAVRAATPVSLLNALINKVVALNLKYGFENSLDVKIDAAMAALIDLNEERNVAALGALDAFINAVLAQSGKAIPIEDSDDLISDAQAVVDLISLT